MADDPSITPSDQLLRSLCEETHNLVKRIPGGVRRLSMRAGDVAIDLEWDLDAVGGAGAAQPAVAAQEDHSTAPHDGRYVLTAPLVGAFYRAPTPGAPPFVEVGDVIEAGQDVAIIEAMKIMNAIQSERAGTVVEILVENADVVEFGQSLMVIEPLENG
jgi:acetyl-CoA carboxylase biotin carboxyl carrier protein